MAIDGHRSNFPNQIDTWQELRDLSPSEKALATRWQELKLQGSLSISEQIEFNDLTTQLSSAILSPEIMNKILDGVVNLQTFFKNETEGYITTKQQEFDATLQKFSDQGIWSNITTYQQWNTISFNNETFLSRKDNNLNHTPVGDVTDIWWHKVAQRGRQGEPGLGLRFTGLFSISKTYSENDAVAYYGDDGYAIYYCLSTCMGIEPTDANHWAIFMSLAQLSSIIGDTNNLLTEDKSSLVNAFNEVFQSVSDGKAQLETAITDMRGAVSKEGEIVSFNELESGVRSIPISKGNALPQYVLEPYTFTNEDGIEYTGTMPNRGAVNHSLPINGSFTISQGCHNGLGEVTQSVPTKGAATYNPSQSDQIITSNQYLTGNQTIKAVPFDASKVLNDTTIAGKQGTMPNRGTVNQTITTQGGQYTIPNGYHNGLGKVTANLDVKTFTQSNLYALYPLVLQSAIAQSSYILDVLLADETGVYCKYDPYAYKIQKYNSNTLTALGQTSLGGQNNAGYQAAQDDVYMYIIYNQILRKINKSSMAISGSITLGESSQAVAVDDNYIYVSRYTYSNFRIYNKSTLALVGESEAPNNRIYTLHVDDNYVWAGTTAYNKSTWSIEKAGSSGTKTIMDNNYIYYYSSDNIWAVNIETGTSTTLNSSAIDSYNNIVGDEKYIYVLSSDDVLYRIPKPNVSGSITSIQLSGTGELASNDNYIYCVAGSGSNGLRLILKKSYTF